MTEMTEGLTLTGWWVDGAVCIVQGADRTGALLLSTMPATGTSRHTGHWSVVATAVEMHSWQKVWPVIAPKRRRRCTEGVGGVERKDRALAQVCERPQLQTSHRQRPYDRESAAHSNDLLVTMVTMFNTCMVRMLVVLSGLVACYLPRSPCWLGWTARSGRART